jgi:hypothetical protein
VGSTASWAVDVTGSGRMTALRTQPGLARVIGVVGSGASWGAQRHGLEEDDIVVGSGTTSWAWG